MLIWLACASPAPEVPEEPQEVAQPQVVQGAPQELSPRFTQEQLAEHPEAVTLQGYLICPDVDGPWTLAVYSAHPEFAGPKADELPWMPPVTVMALDKAGAFSLRSPKAEKLLLMAFQGAGEEQAFTDPDGSYMPVESDLGALVLDCRHSPDWGDAAPTRTLGEANSNEEKGRTHDHSNEWLYATPSGKQDLQQDYDHIEDGYNHYLEVLGDRPDAADMAASLAMMPDQEAAERMAREMQ